MTSPVGVNGLVTVADCADDVLAHPANVMSVGATIPVPSGSVIESPAFTVSGAIEPVPPFKSNVTVY